MVEHKDIRLGDFITWDPYRESKDYGLSPRNYANEPSTWRVVGIGFEPLEGYRLGIGAKDALNLAQVRGEYKPMVTQRQIDNCVGKSTQCGYSHSPLLSYEKVFWYKAEACPRCEENLPEVNDYLCADCRFG